MVAVVRAEGGATNHFPPIGRVKEFANAVAGEKGNGEDSGEEKIVVILEEDSVGMQSNQESAVKPSTPPNIERVEFRWRGAHLGFDGNARWLPGVETMDSSG